MGRIQKMKKRCDLVNSEATVRYQKESVPYSVENKGTGPVIAQGSTTLGNRQTAFDAEVAAIEAVVEWYQHQALGHDSFRHTVIHSDSTSAIARMCHSGAGPGQGPATNVNQILRRLFTHGVHGIQRSAELQWVKGHAGTPGCVGGGGEDRPVGH